MRKRIIPVFLIVFAAMILGGCNLLDKTTDNARLENEYEVATELPGNTSITGQGTSEVDQKQLEQAQKVDTEQDDIDSIESDINSTVILNEDFSDL